MPLSSQSIKNLKGGISQQPDVLRYPNQGAQQINGWSSETKGLQKRPPLVFIKRLAESGHFGTKPLIHLINRDAFEQYQLIFHNGALTIFDLAGNNYPVSGSLSYIATANPREDLRLLTVADYTFILNRTKTVEMNSELTHTGYPALNSRALVSCRGGQYGRTLRIRANGVEIAAYELPDGLAENNTELSKEVAAMDAQAIVKELVKRVNNGTATHGFSAAEGPSHLVIYGNAQPINNIYTEDGYADQLISGLIYQVQTTTKLPITAPSGYLVEITGEASRSGDNYWVRYDGAAKVWKETVKPGIISGLNPGTMPHALIRQADGTFSFGPLTWAKRTAGDDETNPMPSLVDNKLNDVFFFRNRLGFLSGENIIMSKTAKYFQLFPSSAAASADDDPIDVAVSHSRISILKYAVPFSEQLLLWSDQAQFTLTSSGVLSAKTAQLDLTTEFDVLDAARPYGLGRGVYFAAPRARFCSIKRYYAVADVSNVKNAEDVSGHVPTYIPNKVHNVNGSGTENFVSVLTDGDPSKVFIYKFLYQDENLAQQSWSHWTFGKCKILSMFSIGSYTYTIMDRAEGVVLERLEFTNDTVDFPEEPFRCYVDGKRAIELTAYDESTDETYFNVVSLYGGVPDPSEVFWVIDKEGWAQRFDYEDWSSGAIRILGDRRGQTVTVGRSYEFLYEFSKFLIKTQADDGTVSTEDSGRLQLRKVWLNYEGTGSFNIEVDNGRNVFKSTLTGVRLGTGYRLNTLNLGTGQYRFSVAGNAMNQKVTAKSDSPQPLNIIGCGFEGNYIRRSNGI